MLCLLAAGALYATRGQNNGTNAQNATSFTKDAPRHWRSVLLSTVDTTDAATGDAIVFGGPLTLTEVCQMQMRQKGMGLINREPVLPRWCPGISELRVELAHEQRAVAFADLGQRKRRYTRQ